ncbi:hypothetical protein GQ43DRAFT_467655 [Delitschia confertaspora ATCC 74209]|uniref:Uncharacterized protein n=1 Tax=Delitschia confertaspora ATCC 74209 TaxID=1513339 RepID=A0A9P4JVP7_9PLEO|nr:hypothetical protein GQ43DRAFT_467655 [Delitschia confertaspora ATCC 74209]
MLLLAILLTLQTVGGLAAVLPGASVDEGHNYPPIHRRNTGATSLFEVPVTTESKYTTTSTSKISSRVLYTPHLGTGTGIPWPSKNATGTTGHTLPHGSGSVCHPASTKVFTSTTVSIKTSTSITTSTAIVTSTARVTTTQIITSTQIVYATNGLPGNSPTNELTSVDGAPSTFLSPDISIAIETPQSPLKTSLRSSITDLETMPTIIPEPTNIDTSLSPGPVTTTTRSSIVAVTTIITTISSKTITTTISSKVAITTTISSKVAITTTISSKVTKTATSSRKFPTYSPYYPTHNGTTTHHYPSCTGAHTRPPKHAGTSISTGFPHCHPSGTGAPTWRPTGWPSHVPVGTGTFTFHVPLPLSSLRTDTKSPPPVPVPTSQKTMSTSTRVSTMTVVPVPTYGYGSGY